MRLFLVALTLDRVRATGDLEDRAHVRLFAIGTHEKRWRVCEARAA